MKPELAALGFSVGGVTSYLASPVAIRIAVRTEFYDRPREYRQHAAPTPFLGGVAVFVGFLVAALVAGGAVRPFGLLVGCAFGMWVIGTIDDRSAVSPSSRVIAEALAALALYFSGLGWQTSVGVIDVVLTVVWIVGIVNAFNLMDNLDGACSTTACISGAGIGTLAALRGQVALAALAFALSGAAAGFLPHNLAGPAKIFLGDGGSMLLGFLVASLAMASARHIEVGYTSLLVGALLVGVPILDTTLVLVSRWRRGVSLVTGGRDHLTHRLLLALRSPRVVAAALAAAQAVLCGVAIGSQRLGASAVQLAALTAAGAGLVAIAVLDSAGWRPFGIAIAEGIVRSQRGDVSEVQPVRERIAVTPTEPSGGR